MSCTIPIACLLWGLVVSPVSPAHGSTNERVCVAVDGSSDRGIEYLFFVPLSRISDPRNEWDPEKSDFPGDLAELVAEAQRSLSNSGTIVPPVRLRSLDIMSVRLLPQAYSPRAGPVPPNRWCVVIRFDCQNGRELRPGQDAVVMLPDGFIAERVQANKPVGAPTEPGKDSQR